MSGAEPRDNPDPGERRRAVLAWVAIAGFGALSAGLGWWVAHQREAATAGTPPPGMEIVAPGQPVPALTLPDLRTGVPTPLVRPGKVVLVNFWASWCGPCRKEMPILDRYARAQAANGVEVVGIALDEPDAAKAFLAAVPTSFPHLLDTGGAASTDVRLGNLRQLLPYSVLIGPDGRLLRSHVGPFPDDAALAEWAATP